MKKLFLMLTLLPITVFGQSENTNDLWEPFQFLVGTWAGTGDGKWGSASVNAEYQFILNESFLKGTVTVEYPKQVKNPDGEIHVNWDIISFDKARKKYVLRQFHNEYIVNHYVVDSMAVRSKKFEFISESIENFGKGWRAKEAFEILNDDEFIERFSLAAPGKDFQVYITNHFKRKKSID